jgi:hypothetical protein
MGLCCQPSACGCKINFLFNSGRAQQSENAPECSRRTGRTCDIEVVTLRRRRRAPWRAAVEEPQPSSDGHMSYKARAPLLTMNVPTHCTCT